MESPKEPLVRNRIKAAFYGLAICDALGAPLEFGPRIKQSDAYIIDMKPNLNFGLPAGYFTDDTSMALCLAESLAKCKGSDPIDQVRRYLSWLDGGHMSALEGASFDVGVQTVIALRIWQKTPHVDTQSTIISRLGHASRCGNGSLMRVLPCALVTVDEEVAADLARRSSLVTHPHARCVDICELYTRMTHAALQGKSKQELLAKMQIFLDRDSIDREFKDRMIKYSTLMDIQSKPREEIRSSGYVLDTFEAALWSFFRTESFEQGAIEAVNLGDDADTVGAIYGGLSGAFYGDVEQHIPKRWLNEMAPEGMSLIEGVAKLCTDMYGSM